METDSMAKKKADPATITETVRKHDPGKVP